MPPPPSPIAVRSSGHHREPLPFLPYNTINSPPTSAHADPTPSFPFLSFHSLPSSIDIDISSSPCSKPLLQTSTSSPLFASTALKQFFTITAFSNSAGKISEEKPDEPDRRDTVEREGKKKKEKEKSLKKRKREAREKIEESVKVRRVKDEEKRNLKRKNEKRKE